MAVAAGRLDRLVHCGLPDYNDRLDILQAVSRKLTLSDDVNLPEIAAAAQGFTGADLAAILSEAQLIAVHEQIDAQMQTQPPEEATGNDASKTRQKTTGSSGEPASCVLKATHLQLASSRARPSLPASERQRLEAIYARFQQSRDPGISNRPAVPEQDQVRVKHATLA